MKQSEPVFDQAKRMFLKYAEPLRLEQRYARRGLLERLTTPDKAIIFRLSLQMDDGSVRVLQAYRVQFNDDRGPYKGGIRFHPAVTLDEVTALAFWMYLKTAVVNLPLGGAKGGVAVDYKALSASEQERLCKKYAAVMRYDIGQERDIPAPDVNTGPREMAWMLDEWRTLLGGYERGVVTGKPVDLGGSHGRLGATGRGTVFTVQEAAKDIGLDLSQATAAVQGFGNAGYHAARDLAGLGCKVVAVSDSRAAVVHRAGLDIEALNQHKRTAGSVGGFAGAETIAPDRLLILPCDVLIPAALENAITKDNAGQIQARLIGEAANGPTTPEADHILQQRQIVVVPDILANAGGVTVSYFEWVQNRLEMYWDPEQVDQKLRETMVRSYRAVAELARADRTSLRAAAYRLAIERVVQAAIERGVQ